MVLITKINHGTLSLRPSAVLTTKIRRKVLLGEDPITNNKCGQRWAITVAPLLLLFCPKCSKVVLVTKIKHGTLRLQRKASASEVLTIKIRRKMPFGEAP